MDDCFFMELAIAEAKLAKKAGEVPVGAVIVIDNKVISKAHNLRESKNNAVAHAEILAIQNACQKIRSWRLETAVLYITLEPCAMCAGAILMSRIKRVVYGAKDYKAGCAGTIINLLQEKRFNHRCEITSGLMAEESADLLRSFFRELRNSQK